MSKCKTIALCNQKGGVLKTSVTINLGVALAAHGKRVLIVDCDAQGDATTSLGWRKQDDLPVTLSTLLSKVILDEPIPKNEGILHHKEGVDLVPANIELSAMEITLVGVMSREKMLKSYLEPIKPDYDYILLDCPPSLSMLTINALATSDSVIIPVQAQYLPAKGMTQLMQTIHRTRKHINPDLQIEGILLTLSDNRTNLSKNTAVLLRENYGKSIRIFDSAIPLSVKAAEASSTGKSIFAYDPRGKAAQAYRQFVGEVIQHDGKQRTKIRTADAR